VLLQQLADAPAISYTTNNCVKRVVFLGDNDALAARTRFCWAQPGQFWRVAILSVFVIANSPGATRNFFRYRSLSIVVVLGIIATPPLRSRRSLWYGFSLRFPPLTMGASWRSLRCSCAMKPRGYTPASRPWGHLLSCCSAICLGHLGYMANDARFFRPNRDANHI